MIIFPNSKINIGLQIISKREDGYHNLSTLFYPIPLCDTLEIIESERDELVLSGHFLQNNSQKNLVTIALELLRKDYMIPPISIHLHKVIPDGAGLGGGSSDATHTLQLINQKFKLGISNAKLLTYASQIGSDCAFFVKNQAIFAQGRGDEFTNSPSLNLNKYSIYLIIPPIHCSTAAAFQNVHPRSDRPLLEELLKTEISNWKHCIHNDFEDSLFPQFPLLQKIKNKLYDEGAIYASLSGSGSALYGIFSHQMDLSNTKFPNCQLLKLENKN